jgi:hypothetical protein
MINIYYVDCLSMYNVEVSKDIAQQDGNYIQAIIPTGKRKPTEYLIFKRWELVATRNKPWNDFIKNFNNLLDNKK